MQFELRLDAGREPGLTQPLKGVIACGIIRIGVVLLPGPGIISVAVPERILRRCDVRRFRHLRGNA